MPHQGRNLKRIREILGIKQETLALKLGLSQQAISQLEQKEAIDAAVLERVAHFLGVSKEAIQNFDEDSINYHIQNNYEGSNSQASNVINGNGHYTNCQFNALDKLLEVQEENKQLYERLLKVQEEKNQLLERLLAKELSNAGIKLFFLDSFFEVYP
ncbi:helix-turn-helix domain-containing protein [Siphonobacter sp. BAB-5385]|uniref:helix-turn-helix domain-containing protein n=1 Tax=Siphonobacter sp. BAB-5385 TaxID=1864822 RepID=UPI0020CF1B4D|nr:helix-turn-helix transcriptional regulator [Siphonobacter sp. BAB-5385]